jgi:hypothetical protein
MTTQTIRVNLKKSVKGNSYLAINYYNNGYNASSIALFTNISFYDQKIRRTDGLKNLYKKFCKELYRYLESEKEFYEILQEGLENENILLNFCDIDNLNFIITDISKIYGINVDSDGLYIEYKNKLYSMPKYLTIGD